MSERWQGRGRVRGCRACEEGVGSKQSGPKVRKSTRGSSGSSPRFAEAPSDNK